MATKKLKKSAPKPAVKRVSRRHQILEFGVVPLFIYFVLFCFFTWPWITHFNGWFLTDSGDGLQNVWNVWWVDKSVTVLHQLPWHTSFLHAPEGVTLLGQTLNPFNGFVATGLLSFLSLNQAFNVTIIFSFIVAGLTAFWLCYYFTKAYLPSLIGGFIFTFSSYHFAHAIGHMQLVSLEWIPLFILLWWRLLKKPTYSLAIGACLVLLLKEQSLVTDDWPWSIQYRSATGYGCPDTAPCDAEYYGFFNQVYNAARQFERYIKQPQNFNFAAGRTSNIQYNPNSGCGSSPVGIQNGATAALYNYTPYQPNAAALANLYGTGDSCSAYGNRNFWRLFNDWFGSTQTNIPYAWRMDSFQIYANSGRTQPFTADTTVGPGGNVYARITATNLGTETWDRSFMRLGTFRPMQRTSQFYDSNTWLDATRPAQMIESSVAPGGTATFEFNMKAPATTGQYQEYFNLVAENRSWLNDLGALIIINVVSPTTPNNSNNNVLQSGALIRAGQYLLSPDGQSVLTLQDDGNLVLYSNSKPMWNSVTFGKPPDRLEMGADGNLVIYFKDGSTWSTGTQGHSGATLKLQTDGNLVLYDSNNSPLWNTVTFQLPDHLSYVNTRLSTGWLFPGQQLETANRHYRLAFQTDGNVVLYSNTSGKALWNTVTFGHNARFLTLQDDGNLVLYDWNGQPLWNSQTNGRGSSQLSIQEDGNLVLYNGVGKYPWNTATFGQN